jgi:hypothetical protein
MHVLVFTQCVSSVAFTLKTFNVHGFDILYLTWIPGFLGVGGMLGYYRCECMDDKCACFKLYSVINCAITLIIVVCRCIWFTKKGIACIIIYAIICMCVECLFFCLMYTLGKKKAGTDEMVFINYTKLDITP